VRKARSPAPPAAAIPTIPVTGARPKLLYLVTEDWYFCSHRLPIARAARDAGAEVVVATRIGEHAARIAAEGFRLAPLAWRRGGANPAGELVSLIDVIRLYRRERPDLVHHVAMKPTLHGGVAAGLTGVPTVVHALTGLGYLFVGGGWQARTLGPVARGLLRCVLNRPNAHLIMQNPDDLELLRRRGLLRHDQVVLIRGSGVDTARFRPMPEPAGVPAAVLVGRMLSDKGVHELVGAARLLRHRGVPLEVRLVGPPDPHNPSSIPAATLRAWHAEGIVRWLGPQGDAAAVWRDAHIAVLPSYREGLPKALLEAAACGRPLVATEVPGCREVVRDGETGLSVPVRDAVALADALERLAGDPALRRRLGANARRLVEAAFAEPTVVRETLRLYARLLGRRWPSGADGRISSATPDASARLGE
jgi:glycosyltransferase involved in cell wall biosynthesis